MRLSPDGLEVAAERVGTLRRHSDERTVRDDGSSVTVSGRTSVRFSCEQHVGRLGVARRGGVGRGDGACRGTLAISSERVSVCVPIKIAAYSPARRYGAFGRGWGEACCWKAGEAGVDCR